LDLPTAPTKSTVCGVAFFPLEALLQIKSMKKLLILVSAYFLALQPHASSAQSIQYSQDKKIWLLQAGEQSYAFGINERDELQSLFWGGHVSSLNDIPAARSLPERASFDLSTTTTPQEYPGWGAGLYTEPALKVTFSDGNRDLVLHYVSHKIEGNELQISLKDILAPLTVELHYRVYPEQGIIARWSVIENHGTQPFTIEAAASAAWSLPAGTGYEAHWLTGRWAGEWQQREAPVEPGAIVIESRRGSTSHQANPWFEVDRQHETTEESGPAWFGELGWSGSWRITMETSSFEQTRITGGYNPFDFGYKLAQNEKLTTPIFYAGFTNKGRGEVSRLLHHFQQAEIFPGGDQARLRPVLYNSWEATEFNVDEAGQIALAEKAASLGAERFVIDDGWFGQRKVDNAGLGDWYVNPQKFPHGLKPVIDRVHALGMDFGIWVEPEMVNPDSDLYRKHPDWAMNFPGRPRTEGRNQLLLNLARKDVSDYVFGFLDKLVSENDISFLKWDYNRNWAEPGWDAVPVDEQKKIYVQYVDNLYDILARLRAKHPKLEIESCSGGGGRVDLGILRYTDEVWPSDNTDALDRLVLQDGFTRAYSPGVMMAWVTDVPNFLDRRAIPLKFRFLVAMTGSLGIGGNLNHWTADEMKQATGFVSYYKSIRKTVQRGDLYRLITPEENSASATEYVSGDGAQAVVFAFLHAQSFGSPYPTLRLQGLKADAHYRIHSLDDKLAGAPAEATGDWLMHRGITFNLVGDYDSSSVALERLP
jgi:alpha-galactosidase